MIPLLRPSHQLCTRSPLLRFQIEIGEVGALRVLAAFAADCEGRAEAWNAIAACLTGDGAAAVAQAAAADVVRAGMKCLGSGKSAGFDYSTRGSSDAYDMMRFSSISVGSALFHSQAAASAAAHNHVNSTAQLWVHLVQAPLLQSSSPVLPLPLSTLVLFALQNLAAVPDNARLISASIGPHHLLPLLAAPPQSHDTVAATSFAAGSSS
jgi:hypothetical protein